MADRLIRIGRVSKIDYEHGMISVTYPDLDDSVTVPLSTVSFNDEYKMPQIGDEVLAVHLPSGQARVIVQVPFSKVTFLPSASKIFIVVFMSRSLGTRFITHFSSVKSVAINIGNAAFFDPPISTVPFNFLPPLIIN